MRIRLEPGEHVIVRTRPHPRRLGLPFCGALLVLAVAGFGLGAYTRAGLPAGWESWEPAVVPVLLGIALLLLVRIFVRPLMRWGGTHYILTSRRFIRRTGFMRRSEGEVRLTAILQIIIEQTLVERLTGGGSLVIDLGRDRMLVFGEVPQVHKFKEFMVSAIRDLPLTAMFDGVDMETDPIHGVDEPSYGKEQDW